ncbi:peptidase dimerization domain-containing protein [Ktedonospora formicarum]|uniref:Peptidase M20 dimerisation domain-containing protein n=1 Tax=Ktedonospora formicarum TaxID=2778364 RepID=A0A8J3HSG9_9CHLR|nr:peptidase dimerization domain-containing protein [Ktedonospora formicarum]GHO43127.1 hypothetical protein KSX_12900 [Ktedonospora formicarum]
MVNITFHDQLRTFEQTHPLIPDSSPNMPDEWLNEVQARLTRLGFSSQPSIQSTKVNCPTTLFYSEYTTESPLTLLLYNSSPAAQQMWDIFPILARLRALELVQTLLGKLPLTLKWLIQVAPDPGATTFSSFLQSHRERLHAHACLWDDSFGSYEAGWGSDGIPLLMLGCKGRLGVKLQARIPTEQDLLTMHGAVAPNALWRLLWALQSIKDERENIQIEGFYDQLDGPDDEYLTAISALPDSAPRLAQRWSLPALPLGLKGLQLHYTQMLVPTCSLTSLEGQNQEIPVPFIGEQMPREACAYLDFHLVPRQTPEQIFNLLRRHLDTWGFADVEAHYLYGYQPSVLQANESFLHMVQEATCLAYGIPPYVLPMTVSSQPLALLSEHVPTIITSLVGTTTNNDALVNQAFANAVKQTALCIASMAQQHT